MHSLPVRILGNTWHLTFIRLLNLIFPINCSNHQSSCHPAASSERPEAAMSEQGISISGVPWVGFLIIKEQLHLSCVMLIIYGANGRFLTHSPTAAPSGHSPRNDIDVCGTPAKFGGFEVAASHDLCQAAHEAPSLQLHCEAAQSPRAKHLSCLFPTHIIANPSFQQPPSQT
jgi:hypothetical protein